uniref:C2 domain-containing protein n=1 Tax=Glossina austeni TaxID=7395 RepID=A0A1A9VWN9_GLOAU
MLKWTKQQQQLSNLSSLALQQQPKTFQKSIYKKRYSTGNFQISSKAKADYNKMPTMNNYTLERRLHRRSLDNQLDAAYEEQRNRRTSRVSLTSMDNKENFDIHFMRNSFGNTSLTALQDLSNGKSPRRSINEQTPPLLNVKRRSETEQNQRFSDNFCEANDLTPLKHIKFRDKIKEESLSSSRMGDVTLDRMLDAIIESARKEAKPLNHILKDRENEKDLDNSGNNSMDVSVHEMEVRTPQHLKRQRKVVRRKKTDKKAKPDGNVMNRKTEMIGLTLPNGIPSPGTPEFKRFVKHNNYEELFTPSPPIGELQLCSTPTLEETRAIKRCLSFSCNSEDDEGEEFLQLDTKRNSVASSIASSTTEQLSSNSTAPIKGSLDLAIYAHQGILNVHVIRCRDLQRVNGCSSLNAYVKVAVVCKSQPGTGFQRTAVHRHSSRPFFDHRFKFNLKHLYDIIDDIQDEDRLQLAVWHRDRQLK